MTRIVTSSARCRDCYKCIRECPVKAIGYHDGHAWVVEEKCVLCGSCVTACPQNAKTTPSQIKILEKYLAEGKKIVASLAPSYLVAGTSATPWKIIAGLQHLGIEVQETAVGAEFVAKQYKNLFNQRKQVSNQVQISACCPVIVNLIEVYFPNLLPNLVSMISPMQAHAQLIKREQGEDVKVVFIGPCLAKKNEKDLGNEKQSVDIVLTFTELLDYFAKQGIIIDSLPDAFPQQSSSQARLYPLSRGLLHSAQIDQTLLGETLAISGLKNCINTFQDLEKGIIHPQFIEALACSGGCINGPAIGNKLSNAARQARMKTYAYAGLKFPFKGLEMLDLKRTYKEQNISKYKPTEEEIRKVLALTGKLSPEDEANCGGCGYPTCRAKAIAVCQGLAEPEMCIPYMREKAESLSNAIVDTTRSAIIVVGKDMRIQEFNNAAAKMFNRQFKPVKGQLLCKFIDDKDFRTVWQTQQELKDVFRSYDEYELKTRQCIYPIEKYGVVIGIINDITAEHERKEKAYQLRQAYISRATKVIKEEMRVAQQIAGLLGESSAETKATLLELIEVMADEEDLQ